MKSIVFAVLATSFTAHAEWKFQVLVDGAPAAARVVIRKAQEPVGAGVPCLLRTTRQPSTAPLNSVGCDDPTSSAKLLSLARAFKRAAPLATLETDDQGRGAFAATGELDVHVIAFDSDAEARFRVLPPASGTTRLELTAPEEGALEATLRGFGRQKAWLVAVDWAEVLGPDHEVWRSQRLPTNGPYVVLLEKPAVRSLLFARPGYSRPVGLTVSRGGKPVRGAELVVADSLQLKARAKTDAKGAAQVESGYSDLALAVQGKDCALAPASEGRLALAPCTLVEVQVVDAAGKPVLDAVARFKNEEGESRGVAALASGRLLVPPAVDEVEVAAPGFRSVSARLKKSRRVTLETPFSQHVLVVRDAGGVRCMTPTIREPRSAWFHQAGSLYETASQRPVVKLGCPEGPLVEAKLDAPVVQLTLPPMRRLELSEDQELIVPGIEVSREHSYRERRNTFRFFEQKSWPAAWLKTCPPRTRCTLERVGQDGKALASDATKPVSWSLHAVRPDGGVSRGGLVSLRGAATGETWRAEFDQTGAAKLETSPGWFFVGGEDRAPGQWCRAGAACLVKEPSSDALALVRLEVSGGDDDVLVTGPNVRGALRDGVAELELPPGEHTVTVGGTKRVTFRVEKGASLKVPVKLSAPRTLEFAVRGPGGPIEGATVEVGAVFDMDWRPARTVQSDAQGRVRIEGWRDGDVPLLVEAAGFATAAVPAASLDGGVLLTPARRVSFVTDEAALNLSFPAPRGYPAALWGGRTFFEFPTDAGLELSPGDQSVILGGLKWSSGRLTVPADAATVVAQAPAGAALGVGAMFGEQTRLDVFPGAPLSDDELRTGKRFDRPHFYCFAQPTENACITAPLPAGPATVVLSPPERARGPSLVWRVEIPKSGALLFEPPADAKPW